MDAKDPVTEKILNAALKLVNQFGYGSLTLSELARQAKISKQRLYYHFPSTEDVMLILATRWSQTGQASTIQALAQTEEVGAYKILAVSTGMFQWMKEHEELSKLGLVLHQSGSHIKLLNQFMTGARETGRKRLKALLMQSPVFAEMAPAKIENALTAIHSMMYGFYFYVVALNDFKNLHLHEVNCKENLKILIRSYLEPGL